MLTMLRMSGRCSINYRWLRLHLSGTEPTIEAPGASFLQDEIPICPFSFRRAKAPCPDRTRCRRRPNAIGTFWKLRNGVECIGKKPLAITDARKSRRLSGVTNASSVTLSSHALTIAAKRKWRLPSKRSIGCVSSVGRSSFASHDHEAKGRMPSPRASMQQGCRTWTLPGEHDDHALDSTLCARIRETLEPFRSASWTVLARRRDLRQNQKTLDLSLPCRRQRGKNRRLPVARQAGRRRGQSLLPACFQASGPTAA